MEILYYPSNKQLIQKEKELLIKIKKNFLSELIPYGETLPSDLSEKEIDEKIVNLSKDVHLFYFTDIIAQLNLVYRCHNNIQLWILQQLFVEGKLSYEEIRKIYYLAYNYYVEYLLELLPEEWHCLIDEGFINYLRDNLYYEDTLWNILDRADSYSLIEEKYISIFTNNNVKKAKKSYKK